MSSPPSLRDLYIDPNQAWSFVPPILPGPNDPSTTSGPSSSSVPPPASSALAYQFSTRPRGTTALGLSAASSFDLDLDLDLRDLDAPGGAHAARLFKALVAGAVLRYTSSALVMPWEGAKTLLQVQWVPRDAGEEAFGEAGEEGLDDVDHDDAMSDDSTGDDSYFADPHATPTMAKAPAPRARTDEQGYVIRRSVLEEGTRPEYIIPVGSADGVWGMIKRVGRFRAEGWLALWKGLLTACVNEVLSDTLQPMLNGFLQGLLFPSMSPFHQPPIILPVMSHLITGFLLSPLDLIRTRLIIQSFTARYKRYSGPIDAFRQILRDEGGLRGMYLHPHLLIPTLLDSGVRPLLSLTLPGLLTSYFGYGHITEDTHPAGWGMAELAGSCLGLLATLPIETVRRRLQAQTRGTAAPVKACVELRPAPYNGVVDALWHVLTEERSDLPIAPQARRRRMSVKGKEKEKDEKEPEADDYQSWMRNTGIGQLYRGLGMRLGASAIVFVLAMLGGGNDVDGGWAEI